MIARLMDKVIEFCLTPLLPLGVWLFWQLHTYSVRCDAGKEPKSDFE
jgi:hypothetical protein